jgi:AcrR family transcriptional regulator
VSVSVPALPGATVREQEIFTATLDLVAEHGYDRLTMDAIAAASRAGKATLYRRWASKAELVVAAVVELKSRTTPSPRDTGTLRGDLLSGVCAEMGLDDPRQMAIMSGLSTAIHSDPELREAFVEGFLAPRRIELEQVFQRAVDRGELPDGADVALLATVLPALAVYHTTFATEQVRDPGFMTRVVDQVVLPMTDQHAPR